jgi:hypothetical protein
MSSSQKVSIPLPIPLWARFWNEDVKKNWLFSWKPNTFSKQMGISYENDIFPIFPVISPYSLYFRVDAEAESRVMLISFDYTRVECV